MSPPFLNREFFFLAPEIFLTTWGVLLLVFDFSVLRKATAARRNRVLGMLTLGGTVLALVLGILALAPESVGLDINIFGWNPLAPFALGLADGDYALFGGTLGADTATAMLNITVLVLLALVVGLSMSWEFTAHVGEYYALLLWATVGMMFLIASEELITLFLTLETMTLCLYMMASLEKSKRRSAEAGLKYFVYGSVSSALFLFGLSLIYGLTGTTTLSSIRLALNASGPAGLQGNIAGAAAVLLVMVGLGFKISAVPFHQWAPDTYEGAPAPVSAWIAAGSKTASFAALLKLMLHAMPSWASSAPITNLSGNFTSPGWIGIIAVISAVTMTYGNFAALAQKNLKRMLAYSSIAHAGYMLVGVLAAAVSVDRGAAVGAVLYYLVVYGFATVGAFAVAAWLARDKDSDEISDLDGLGYRSPGLAVCIVLLMLSLIGMPPLAGFFGKLYMFMEAMNSGERGGLTLQWLVMLGLFNSVVSAFYYVRVLKAMFLRRSEGTPSRPATSGVAWAITIGAIASVGLGLEPSLVELMKGAGLPLLSTGARISKSTAADPKIRTTEAEREALYNQKSAQFKAGGGGIGGVGAPPPQAKGKAQRPAGSPKGKAGRGAAAPESKKDVNP